LGPSRLQSRYNLVVLKLKRAYEPAEASDGYRILVDRIWPRGISKKRAHVAVWLKELGPSTPLRKWFGHDPARWGEFQKRYRRELQDKPELIARIRQLEQEYSVVTLIFSARDEEHNQAVVLRDVLAGSRLERRKQPVKSDRNKPQQQVKKSGNAKRTRAGKKVRG
jgi:uncharacterized protein YeaO (DUF488 family)